MTKELRERLYEKFKSYYDRGAGYEIIEMEMLALLEQEIKEAERRGREEMRKECLDCIPPDNTIEFGKDEEYQRGHSEGTDARNHTIRTAISSLK